MSGSSRPSYTDPFVRHAGHQIRASEATLAFVRWKFEPVLKASIGMGMRVAVLYLCFLIHNNNRERTQIWRRWRCARQRLVDLG